MPSWRKVTLNDLGPELGIDLTVPYFDVTDQRHAGGARGDGVTDDTVPIQAALNAASLNGGIVLFPVGTYLISAALTYKSSNLKQVLLRGAGMSQSVIQQKVGTADVLLKSGDSATQQQFLVLEDLGFSAFSNQTANTGGLLLEKTGLSKISRVLVSYCNNYLIQFLGGNAGGDVQDNSILGCQLGNVLNNKATTYMVYLAAGSAGKPDGTRIIDTNFNSILGTGVKTSKAALSAGPDFALIGCSMQTVPTVLDVDGPATKIIANRFESTSGAISAVFQSTANYCTRVANSWAATGGITITDNTAFGRAAVFGDDVGGSLTMHLFETGGLQFFETANVGTPDLNVTRLWKWTISDANNKTVAAPINSKSGDDLTFDIFNNTGGALGTMTWNAVFKQQAAWVQPAAGKRRTITYYYDGTSWVETGRATTDI